MNEKSKECRRRAAELLSEVRRLLNEAESVSSVTVRHDLYDQIAKMNQEAYEQLAEAAKQSE